MKNKTILKVLSFAQATGLPGVNLDLDPPFSHEWQTGRRATDVKLSPAPTTDSGRSLSLTKAIWAAGEGGGIFLPGGFFRPNFVKAIYPWHDSQTSSWGWNQTPPSYLPLKTSPSLTYLLWSRLIYTGKVCLGEETMMGHSIHLNIIHW